MEDKPMTGMIELLVDDSSDSKKAMRLFREAGIDYRRIWADGPKLPTAYYAHSSFSRLSGILMLIDILTKETEGKDSTKHAVSP